MIGTASTSSGRKSTTVDAVLSRPTTDTDARVKPSTSAPESPMKIRAGKEVVTQEAAHAPATIAESTAASTFPSERAITAKVDAGDRAHARCEPVHAVEEVDHVHDGDDPHHRHRHSDPARNVDRADEREREMVDPDAERRRDRSRENLARELRQRSEAAEVVDGADDAGDGGAEQDAAHLAREVEEGERRHEDADEDREPAEPRDRSPVEPPLVRVVDDPEQPGHPADSGRQERRRSGVRSQRRRGPPGCPEARSSPPTSCRTGGRLRRRGPARCSRSRSARGRSTATTIDTSGWSRWIRAIPSGAAISAIRRTERGARLLHRRDRGGRRVAGREHRVEQDHVAVGDVVRQLDVVLDRLERLLVPVEADEADARARESATARRRASPSPPAGSGRRRPSCPRSGARWCARAASRSRSARRPASSSPRT